MKIGIVGGGQLARMMVLAGEALDISFIILDPSADCTAGKVCEQIIAEYDDIEALTTLASKVDIITFDFENVPADALAHLEENCTVYPPTKALRISQDRIAEKTLFNEYGIETAPYAAIDSLAGLEKAIESIGTPCVLKTRRFGYDGKGQFVIKDKKQAEQAWQAINQQPAILEGFIDFTTEVSLVIARSSQKEVDTVFYPLTENHHKNGILHISRAPYLSEALLKQAQGLLKPLLEHLSYVGVLTIEFFVQGDKLIANELAPRVHNSGHWTIEGAACSQFENHIRAISGLDLGKTDLLAEHAAMVNFISAMPQTNTLSNLDTYAIHDYEKAARKDRKVGHATITGNEQSQVEEKIKALEALL